MLRSAMILFLWSFVQKNCIFFFVTSNVVRNSISSANMVLRQSSKLYEYNRTTLSLFCYTLIAALNGNSQENAINLKNCILDKLHINAMLRHLWWHRKPWQSPFSIGSKSRKRRLQIDGAHLVFLNIEINFVVEVFIGMTSTLSNKGHEGHIKMDKFSDWHWGGRSCFCG